MNKEMLLTIFCGLHEVDPYRAVLRHCPKVLGAPRQKRFQNDAGRNYFRCPDILSYIYL